MQNQGGSALVLMLVLTGVLAAREVQGGVRVLTDNPRGRDTVAASSPPTVVHSPGRHLQDDRMCDAGSCKCLPPIASPPQLFCWSGITELRLCTTRTDVTKGRMYGTRCAECDPGRIQPNDESSATECTACPVGRASENYEGETSRVACIFSASS